MPASKRGSSPHDSQPKMRKLDEDGEALQSKTAPATNIKSLKTGNMQEMTVVPRTKTKLSTSADGGNKPAKASKQSSPPKDSSKTISDPPVKKAKLLKATSASCGEAPSQKAPPKTSLKRAASTESDEDLSSDGGKTDLFRERDDGDKARCIRQYSNRVRAKRKAEESSSDPQEISRELSPAPADPVQMDHNYGRFSDLLNIQNADEAAQNEKKESAEPDTEAQRQESSDHGTKAESKESSVSETGSMKASVTFECAADKSEPKEFKKLEIQKLIDKDKLTSSRDSFTDNTDDAESINNQKYFLSETLPPSVETTCSSGGKGSQSCEGEDQADENLDSVCRPESQTHLSSETETNETSVSCSDEMKLNLRCKTEAGEHEITGETEAAGVCPVDVEDQTLSDKANSTPDEILVESINPESQTDLSVKIQVTFQEESKSDQVPDTITNSCDGVNKIVRKSDEQLKGCERKEAEFLSAQAAADPGSVVEVQLSCGSQEVKTKTTERRSEMLTSVPEQSPREGLCERVTVSEGQIHMDTQTKITSEDRSEPAPNEATQNQTSLKFNDTTETPVEVEEGVKVDIFTSAGKENFERGTAQTSEEISNPASSPEIQNQKNQEVSEPTRVISGEFHEDHMVENSGALENEHKVNSQCASGSESQIKMEVTATLTSEDSDQTPAKETQPQKVGEPTTDISAEIHEDLMVGNSENVEKEEKVDYECQNEMGMQTITASKVEVQKQGSPVVSEATTGVSDEVQKDSVPANCNNGEDEDRIPPECVAAPENQIEINVQTTTSEGICNIVPTVETLSLNMQEVSEPATDVCAEYQADQKVESPARETTNNFESVTAEVDTQTSQISEKTQSQESQIEVDIETRTQEIPIIAPIAEMHQENQDITEHNVDVSPEVHEDLAPEKSQNMEKVNYECVAVPENQMNSEMHATPEISNLIPTVEKQSQKVEVNMETASEEVSNIVPTVEIQSEQTADIKSEIQTTSTPASANLPCTVEIQSQESQELTEPAAALSEVQEGVIIPTNEYNENKVIAQCVNAVESQIEIDIQTAAEEISDPTSTMNMQIQKVQEVSESTTDAGVEKGLIIANTERREREDEDITATVNQTGMETETTATPEDISNPGSTSEMQMHESQAISELTTAPETQKEQMRRELKDDGNNECAEVSEFQINMKATAKAEETVEQQNHRKEEVNIHTMVFSNEIQKPLPVADFENKEDGALDSREDMDVISGSIERVDPVLEEETGRRGINEVKEGAAIVSANASDKMLHNTEGQGEGTGSSEVVVLACGAPDDADVVVQDAEEKSEVVNQPRVEFHENQIVYEPISSPESNEDEEFCPELEKQDGVSLLDAQQMKEASSANEENRAVGNLLLETVKDEMCVSNSQAVIEMEVRTLSVPERSVSAQPEQSGATVDVKQVAVISSSDDISVPERQSDGAMEKGERNGFPECVSATEFSEQLQEGTGGQEVADVRVTTTTAVAAAEIPDSTSEEYVILEPVPESEIPFDIVTQAAAESGLSDSLSEQVNPDSALAGDDENQRVLTVSQQSFHTEVQAQPCQTTNEVKDAPVTNSGEDENAWVGTETSTASHLEEGVQVIHNSDHVQQMPSDMMDVNTTEVDMAHAQGSTEDGNKLVTENVEGNFDLHEVQILEDIEIGHEIVVAEEDNEEDGDITIIEKPQETPEAAPPKKPEEKVNEQNKNDTCGTDLKQNNTADKTEDDKKGEQEEKPKKQAMNTQARTKARLAALAEQKAAASKRTANRQQLNLLALCQEIAEDIATDSMLLKRIEEEKQAAAAAAAAAATMAAAAAKGEASKKESPPVTTQEVDAADAVTPAGPEGSSAPENPADEASAAQPSTAESAEAKPTTEPQKRRFFITQISVPLKAHEKKKLTRYQRLRQVELQREKMSWARVKKMKSDQANQMFSDMDWQPPLLSVPSPLSVNPVTTDAEPAASPSKPPLPSPASSSKPVTPKAEVPKIEAPKAEVSKTEPPKTEPTKTETSKTEPPKAETPKTTRQSRAQTAKATPPPGPSPKVTRSSTRRSLPAVPPPMPNGFNAQKTKTEVEYKPYRPRPKYSFDDFELDDDPLPRAPAKPTPQSRPTRPNPQSKPTTAQSKPTLPSKPSASSQLANQAKLSTQPPSAGQVSGQSKLTVSTTTQSKPASSPNPQSKLPVAAAPQSKASAAASSKPAPPAKPQQKSPVSITPQSKAASAPGQSRPAASASASPQLKTAAAATAQPKQSTPTAAQPATSTTSETKPATASIPQKTPNPPRSEDEKCKDTAGSLSSAAASSLPCNESPNVSDDTQQCEEKPAVTDDDPPAGTETVEAAEKTSEKPCQDRAGGGTSLSEASLQKEVKKLRAADKDGTQTIIDAGQKHFGAVACSVCGMLYSAANPEDESQHLLFHSQFISAVKYVGWKKERILGEYPDGKIILVLPDDPKYALKKVEEIREMVDNDLGFQQVETKCPSQTKTFLFISNDKKVAGCLIAEHIQEGYRVIEEPIPEGSEGEKVMFERQRAWCCSTMPESAICGISRIWVVNMMRRQGLASRLLECLRNNFIYGSYLSKDEIAFSDPTPDGKLFATNYFGTSQFLVYNFVSGRHPTQCKTDTV